MGATKIMIVRHAEKPGIYNGTRYSGVNSVGSVSGDNGIKHLVTLGWERAGGLVTLFAPPWGPKTPTLATPQFLFASNPVPKNGDDSSDEGPSERPCETLMPLAARLRLNIDTTHRKKQYAEMASAALACDGVVLIAWQHQDIALKTKAGAAGISQEILKQTNTKQAFDVPRDWPAGKNNTQLFGLRMQAVD
jgi:hypothetical protein